MIMFDIAVIGIGYIGFPTALFFAANGYRVCGVDIAREKVDKLRNGILPFEENGLPELFARAAGNGIRFSQETPEARHYIVAVPTPYREDSKRIDPVYLIAAVKQVLQAAPPEAVLIIESTVAPGTMDKSIRPLLIQRGDIALVHMPERVIPGNMIREFTENSRTVGADDPAVARKVAEMYASFCKGEFVYTDIRHAEMSKVVENTYRDVNIALANELLQICNYDGQLDVHEIIRIANKHPRVNIMQPGPGVGGHCINIEPWFLVGDYPGLANLILTARHINDDMPAYVLRRAREVMRAHGLADMSRVGLYGLTYKENVDDTRESPAVQLLRFADEHFAAALPSYDPLVTRTVAARQYFSLDAFLANVDMVIVLAAHKQLADDADAICRKVVLDTRNCLDGIQKGGKL
jgi:UDP-N-acetyl-D-mannosaminuronic acid dehydrogenase